MKQNVVTPLIKGLSDNEKNEKRGYVIVDGHPSITTSNHSREKAVRVLSEVVIPKEKMTSYDLFKALHDNYNWRRHQDETNEHGEQEEINKLLDYVVG
ncbi:hypothetical protein ACFVQB_19990 [Paenibacillus sp. NPDC057886]|uniref:hypothetical protein n=1 Tax=Paenibacillus sp. NPDC057886 TaxID=3346270 RepID=UPI00369BA3AC